MDLMFLSYIDLMKIQITARPGVYLTPLIPSSTKEAEAGRYLLRSRPAWSTQSPRTSGATFGDPMSLKTR